MVSKIKINNCAFSSYQCISMSLRQAYLKTGGARTTNPEAAHSATLICWLVLFPLGSRAGVGVSQTLTRSSQSQPPLQSEPNVMSETFLEQVPEGHWGQTPNTYLSSTNCALAVFASQQKGPGFDWQVGVCWDGSSQETIWYNNDGFLFSEYPIHFLIRGCLPECQHTN